MSRRKVAAEQIGIFDAPRPREPREPLAPMLPPIPWPELETPWKEAQAAHVGAKDWTAATFVKLRIALAERMLKNPACSAHQLEQAKSDVTCQRCPMPGMLLHCKACELGVHLIPCRHFPLRGERAEIKRLEEMEP